MIAHVAEAGEARGRVVLALDSCESSPTALEAAVRVAQAFNSEIESLFVEQQELMRLARFPFAREVSLTGRAVRPMTPERIERDIRLMQQAVSREIEALARAAEVPLRRRVVSGGPVAAVQAACAECGPWNVIALAEPLGPRVAAMLAELWDSIADATGIVLVGPKARRTHGPVVLAVERADALTSMLHAAERLARVTGGDVVVLPLSAEEPALAHLEGEIRLALAGRSAIRIADAGRTGGHPEAVAEAFRRLACGFVIAEFGGIVLPGGGQAGVVALQLECPLFVVRYSLID
jgi:hypothetical protein